MRFLTCVPCKLSIIGPGVPDNFPSPWALPVPLLARGSQRHSAALLSSLESLVEPPGGGEQTSPGVAVWRAT